MHSKIGYGQNRNDELMVRYLAQRTQRNNFLFGQINAVIKAGRVLSQQNENDLTHANALLDEASELIEGVLEQVTGQPVVEPADTGPD